MAFLFQKFIILIGIVSIQSVAYACSMYKVTVDGKTMVGTNEDSWNTTPYLWFSARTDSTFGCGFTGSRPIGNNRYAAQSGMNEFGLAFSRLASYYPKKKSQNPDLRKIHQPDLFVEDVLKKCKTVEEVKKHLEQFDRSVFIELVFVYIEPSGKYLIVEPYNIIEGNDPNLVQSNFCPSITPEEDRRLQTRYRDGKDFLQNKSDTTIKFCTSLSKEMHVCRDKLGDGTLLTTIWDTKNIEFTLFFYHNYKEKKTFNLKNELVKGTQQYSIEALFSKNNEFKNLKNYITPFNTPLIRFVLMVFGLIFFFSSLIFGFWAFKKKNRLRYITLSCFFMILFIYMFVLTTNREIFYFPSPYVHYASNWVSVFAYTPYLVILFLIWFMLFRRKIELSRMKNLLLNFNTIFIIFLSFGLLYWRLLF